MMQVASQKVTPTGSGTAKRPWRQGTERLNQISATQSAQLNATPGYEVDTNIIDIITICLMA